MIAQIELIVKVFCRDLPHLTHLITEQVQLIPGVRSTETLVIAKTYKLSYGWSPAPGLEVEVVNV